MREGAIIPHGDIVKVNNNWDTNWRPKLEIEIFPSRVSARQFEYFTGQGVQKISVASSGEGITVEFGDLGAGGNLAVYCRKVRGVTKDGKTLGEGSDYHYDLQTQKLTVPFTGPASLLIKGAETACSIEPGGKRARP